MKKYVKDVGVKYFSCKIPSPAKKKKKNGRIRVQIITFDRWPGI